MRRALIRILFWLLGDQEMYQNIDQKRIAHFLVTCYNDLGFREYWRIRDLQILKALGQGLPRDEYLIKIGQRFEQMHMLDQINKAYKAFTRASAEKGKTQQRSSRVEEDPEIIKSRKAEST